MIGIDRGEKIREVVKQKVKDGWPLDSISGAAWRACRRRRVFLRGAVSGWKAARCVRERSRTVQLRRWRAIRVEQTGRRRYQIL